jgi:phosphate transport system permease protein
MTAARPQQPSVIIPSPTAGVTPAPSTRRFMKDTLFKNLCLLCACFSVLILVVLIAAILIQGLEYLSLDYLQNGPSRKPAKAGIYPALMGSIWVCLTCTTFALPIGVGTAVLLEEYRPKNNFLRKLHGIVQLNITNLAGVPSIVYGILGMTVFVQMFGRFGVPLEPAWTFGTPDHWYYIQLPFGRGVLAGGLTLALVILPIIIVSSQEALRAVPNSLRNGVLALGATKWQMVAKMTLPSAIPGIMTGAILAMSRAIGEAAPILIIAGVVYITFTPQHLMDDFTAMPLQIYDWAGRPQEEFHKVAATGIIVLLTLLLTFNSVAVLIRQKFNTKLL